MFIITFWVLVFPCFHSKKLTETCFSVFCKITYVPSYRRYRVVKLHECCASRLLHKLLWRKLHAGTAHPFAWELLLGWGSTAGPWLCCVCTQAHVSVLIQIQALRLGFMPWPHACLVSGWLSDRGSAWPQPHHCPWIWMGPQLATLQCGSLITAPAFHVPTLCFQLTCICLAVSLVFPNTTYSILEWKITDYTSSSLGTTNCYDLAVTGIR